MTAGNGIHRARGRRPRLERFQPLDIGFAELNEPPPPPREWLLGNQFCRGFVSAVTSRGAGAKTSLRHLQYLALASGRELTGDHVFQRCNVLVICLEDDAREMRRRFRAALLHHRIDPQEIAGRLWVLTPRDFGLVQVDGRRISAGHSDAQIRDFVQDEAIGLVSLDPFKKISRGIDESDNDAIDAVCTILTSMAIDLNIAVDLLCHERKGSGEPGDSDRGRGASSRRDAVRLEYTVTEMTAEEATQFGVPAAERRSFVRLDPAKVNLAPPGAEARWFRLVGVPIGNPSELYPNGDVVATVEPWSPPDFWDSVPSFKANQILDKIAVGLPDGRLYSAAPQASRAAWQVVKQVIPELTDAQARRVIKKWIESGVIATEAYRDPVERKDARGLIVNDAGRPT